MNEPKLEVPAELRDLAEKTIEQAEKAFGMFFDAANRSITSVPNPGTEMSKQALSLTQQNIKAAFEPMAATTGYLAQTRTLNELSQLVVVPCGLGAPESLSLKHLPAVRGMVDDTISEDGTPSESFLLARLDWLWDRICGGKRRIDEELKESIALEEVDAHVGEIGPATGGDAALLHPILAHAHRFVLFERGDVVHAVLLNGHAGHAPVALARAERDPAAVVEHQHAV